jgi:hypothetical protein
MCKATSCALERCEGWRWRAPGAAELTWRPGPARGPGGPRGRARGPPPATGDATAAAVAVQATHRRKRSNGPCSTSTTAARRASLSGGASPGRKVKLLAAAVLRLDAGAHRDWHKWWRAQCRASILGQPFVRHGCAPCPSWWSALPSDGPPHTDHRQPDGAGAATPLSLQCQ